MDDIGAVDANGVPYNDNDHSADVDDLEINLILGVCLEYVTSDRPGVPDQGLTPLVPVIPGDIPTPGGGSGPTTTTKTVSSSWRISQAVDPLLDFAKKWHQDSPFNNYNHNRRKYGFCGPQRHAPAGCFPLSIAKIFTYFKKPSPMYRGNYLINWDELYKDFSSPIGRESAAHLIRLIVDGCDSWCFYKGTFTFPNKALSYIKRQGYTDAKDVSYDFNRVKLMISKKKPVIIYALPGINITKSHAWNIDGYKIQERTDTIKTYNDRKEVIKTETKTVKAEMVHCDFGCQGRATGYYASSIFKSKGELTEIDNPSLGVPEINFNNYKRVITY